MKKVSTLLLTGILGTSMMFAGFSGTATLDYSVADLDAKTFGMSNVEEWEAEVELFSSTVESAGEGDMYAEVAATLTLTTSALDQDTTEEDTLPGDDTVTLDDVRVIADPSFDYARVVGDGWKVSILGPNGPVDYAADTIALDEDDNAYNYSVAGNTAAGVAVCLDDLGTVSLGLDDGDYTALENTDVYAAVELAEVELAEGMTAQVGASFMYDNDVEFAGSAKVSYAADDMSVCVAADAGKDAANGLGLDVKASVDVAPVALDVYYATENTNDDDFDEATADIADVADMLNVKAVADLNDFDVPVSLTVKGLDLVNAQDLKASADVTVNEELALCVSGGYGLVSEAWDAGVSATYTVDAYTAEAAVGYNSAKDLSASASVESTTLVDGATLTLAWADGDALQDGSALGSVTASCAIAF